MSEQDVFSSIAQKSAEKNEGSGESSITPRSGVEPNNQTQATASGRGKGQPIVKITSASKDFAKLNQLTSNGFKEMKDTMKEGFMTMRDSFLEIGRMFAGAMEERSEDISPDYEGHTDENRNEEQNNEDGDEDSDIFRMISGTQDEQEAGPNVQENLAKMMD